MYSCLKIYLKRRFDYDYCIARKTNKTKWKTKQRGQAITKLNKLTVSLYMYKYKLILKSGKIILYPQATQD